MQETYTDIGHSLPDATQRRSWIELVSAISALVKEQGLSEEILFHGTTIGKARQILRKGMQPTDAFEFGPYGEEMCSGSFWGTVETAAWYAEDSSLHRKGGRPAIIACPVSFLQTYATLGADIPTRDFPIPGLTLLDDPDVAAHWPNEQARSWQESLRDLGAVTAIHDYDLSLDVAILVDEIESLERILHNPIFSS
jgi:hypothetical protein